VPVKELSVIQRRAVAGIALAASTTMLAACGFQAPAVTNIEHSEVQGTSFAVGAVKIRAAFITSVPASALGDAPVGAAPTTPTALVVTFVNDTNTADTLTGASSSLGPVSLAGPGASGGQLTIPRLGVPVQVVDPNLGTPGPTLTIAAKAAPVLGTFVRVNFTFANAGTSATVQVPVVPPGETEQATTQITGVPATPPPDPGDSTTD
jgi:hypothetical protein